MRRGTTRASPLRSATGNGVTVVHLTAEYTPYARTGGLAEAVHGLATIQTRQGISSSSSCRSTAPCAAVARNLEQVGEPFTVHVGPRREQVRFFRDGDVEAGPAGSLRRAPGLLRPRGHLRAKGGADYPDNPRRFALFARAALEAISLAGEGSRAGARARLAYGARARLPAVVLGSAPTLSRDAGRALRPQRGLSGTLLPGGHRRPGNSSRDLQLPSARVVREGQLPQGRPRLLRSRGHRESDPRRRAAHTRGWIRPARHVHVDGRSIPGNHQRDRPEHLESGHRHADHRALHAPGHVEQGELQGRAAAHLRAAAAEACPDLRHVQPTGEAEGTRHHPRQRSAERARRAVRLSGSGRGAIQGAAQTDRRAASTARELGVHFHRRSRAPVDRGL